MDNFNEPIPTQPPEEQMRYLRLIHNIFHNSKHGKELLEIWKDIYLFSPTLAEGKESWMPLVREGENRVIRGIMSDLNSYKYLMELKNNGTTSSS